MLISIFLSLLMTSLILSLLIVIFAFFSRAFPRLMSSRTRYTIWVFILIILLLPIRPLLGKGLFTIVPPHVARQTAEVADKTVIVANASLSIVDLISYALLAIWVLGSFIYLIHHIIQYVKLRRLIQRVGVKVTDPDILESFHNLTHYMDIKPDRINLVTCNFIKSPMLTGFRHPVILIPDQDFTSKQMEVILEHELTHYIHRDLLINLLMIVATSLHWFNPVIRFSNKVVQEEGEILCDESVLRGKNLDYRRFYGKVILSLIESGEPKTVALSTYFFESKSNLQHRLMAILDVHNPMKRLSYLSVLTSVGLILLSKSVFVLATDLDPTYSVVDTSQTEKSESSSTSETSETSTSSDETTETSQTENSSSTGEAASSTQEAATPPVSSETAAVEVTVPATETPSAPAAPAAAPVYSYDDDDDDDDDD